MIKIEYVCGLLFTKPMLQGTQVLLINKLRPAAQAGKLNGVGGKIEVGETPMEAMHREFMEEAGVEGLLWFPVAELTGDHWKVHFFSAWADGDVSDAVTSKTDEKIMWLNLRDLPTAKVMANLRVLIPLALDQSGIVKPVLMRDDVPQAA